MTWQNCANLSYLAIIVNSSGYLEVMMQLADYISDLRRWYVELELGTQQQVKGFDRVINLSEASAGKILGMLNIFG